MTAALAGGGRLEGDARHVRGGRAGGHRQVQPWMTPIWNTAEKRNLAYLYETDSKYLQVHDVDFDSMLDQPGAVPPLWKRAAPAAAAAAAGAGFDANE